MYSDDASYETEMCALHIILLLMESGFVMCVSMSLVDGDNPALRFLSALRLRESQCLGL